MEEAEALRNNVEVVYSTLGAYCLIILNHMCTNEEKKKGKQLCQSFDFIVWQSISLQCTFSLYMRT